MRRIAQPSDAACGQIRSRRPQGIMSTGPGRGDRAGRAWASAASQGGLAGARPHGSRRNSARLSICRIACAVGRCPGTAGAMRRTKPLNAGEAGPHTLPHRHGDGGTRTAAPGPIRSGLESRARRPFAPRRRRRRRVPARLRALHSSPMLSSVDLRPPDPGDSLIIVVACGADAARTDGERETRGRCGSGRAPLSWSRRLHDDGAAYEARLTPALRGLVRRIAPAVPGHRPNRAAIRQMDNLAEFLREPCGLAPAKPPCDAADAQARPRDLPAQGLYS